MTNQNKNVLVIIPARGGSKGIPRKNLRHFLDKPLICHVINTAKEFNILVSSDDDEILDIALKSGVNVHKRPDQLASDDATLEGVIYDALLSTKRKDWCSVVTIQPTSPLLNQKTLFNALKYYQDSKKKYDTIVSVVDDSHLRWSLDKNGNPKKLYKKRLNRQYLPREFKETGAFVITSVNQILKNNSRFGKRVGLFEISEEESIDIDNYNDWKIAENLALKTPKIYFITKGNYEIGTGHIYNCLTLATVFGSYDVNFLFPEKNKEFSSIISSRNYKINFFEEEKMNFQHLSDAKLIIVDYLDVSVDFVKSIKNFSMAPIISFENLGEGASLCDLVFNPIYKPKFKNKIFNNSGPKYFILRDEFILNEKLKFNENLKTVLIAYGGLDPCDLTLKTLKGIYSFCISNSIKIIVLLGKPYKNRKKIEQLFPLAEVKQNVFSVSNLMSISDLAFTSSGRTSFELTHINVPCIISSQNSREEMHYFSDNNYHVYLGKGKKLKPKDFLTSLISLYSNIEIRKKIYNKLSKLDLTSGIRNTNNEIKKYL